MSRRLTRSAAVPLLLLILGPLVGSAVASPAGGSGGGGLAPGPNDSGSGSSTSTLSQPASATVQSSGNGITLVTRPVVLLRSRLHFSGRVDGAPSSAIVEIERRGKDTQGSWLPTTHGVVAADGTFMASWPTNQIGRFSIRAVVGSRRGSISRAAAPSPALTITVYRPAIATTYGPGFWGSRTACGQILHHNTLGVAHRTLPCGTPVSLLWHGRTIVVPVIDRGPYANHADWDLTSATATALGITGTETIGATSLSR